MLTKLARWAEGKETLPAEGINDLDRLIAEARPAVEAMDDEP